MSDAVKIMMETILCGYDGLYNVPSYALRDKIEQIHGARLYAIACGNQEDSFELSYLYDTFDSLLKNKEQEAL